MISVVQSIEMQRLKIVLRKLYQSPQKTFLIIAGTFGLLFILLTPPLQTPDEIVHFMRAYQVSELGVVSTNKDGALGGYLPASIGKSSVILSENPTLTFNPNTKYDVHKTIVALKIPLEKEKRDFLNIAGATGYSPIGYIPQAIGIAIGAFFNAPAVVLMYMARVASLVTWIGLIFFSIKIIPQKKWAIVGLGVLPMILAQAGSPGIDAISIGLGILFIALVMKYRTLVIVSGSQLFSLFLIACLIALTKQTTILVVGFIFLLSLKQIDANKFKASIKIAATIIIPILLLVGWLAVVKLANLSADSTQPGQNSIQQVANLIHHPLRLPEVIYNTFFFNWGDGVINSFIGVFGWVDTPLAGMFIMMGYVLIALILFANYEKLKKKLSKKDNLLIVILAAMYAVGTCAALYIIYSPVDYDIVYGLQGRYFLLSLFIIAPILMSVPLRLIKKHYVITVCVLSILLLTVSAMTIFYRYYLTVF